MLSRKSSPLHSVGCCPRYSESIRFLGAYNASKAPAIYQAADAYLMMKYNDPCPNTVLEALASGLPVLYSASGGVPELVGLMRVWDWHCP